MKNTERLFEKAMAFQNERAKIVEEYESRMKALSSAQGSLYYEEESEKAEKKRDAAMEKLKKGFYLSMEVILTDMNKANNSRTFEAPTDEEMTVINALKMRETLTDAEITTAANTLKTPLALSILRELARKSGYKKHIASETDAELTIDAVSELIKSLSRSLSDFAEFDTTKASRIAKEYKERKYGLLPEEDNTPLPKRKPFNDIDGLFDEVCPYLSQESRTAFIKAVDGEKGSDEQ